MAPGNENGTVQRNTPCVTISGVSLMDNMPAASGQVEATCMCLNAQSQTTLTEPTLA